VERLSRAGVYLARLDPAKGAEIGKLRPVIVLTAEEILAVDPALLFVCPLSSHSTPEFEALHVALRARDGLKVGSFALVEHCRAISRRRVLGERIARASDQEFALVLHRLQRLVGL